jgi:hypothetical protein
MRLVAEVVGALLGARGPTEVVDRDRCNAALRRASSSKKGWSPRTSGRITIPAPVPCFGRAWNARNCAPSAAVRSIDSESAAAPLIGSMGGRLSWVVHMPG